MQSHKQFSENKRSWNINFHPANRMWAQPCHNYLNPLVRRRVRLRRVRQRTEQTQQGQEESRSVVSGPLDGHSDTGGSLRWPAACGLCLPGELERTTLSERQSGLRQRDQQSTSECLTVLWTAQSLVFSRLSVTWPGVTELWGLISHIYFTSHPNWIFVTLDNTVAN